MEIQPKKSSPNEFGIIALDVLDAKFNKLINSKMLSNDENAQLELKKIIQEYKNRGLEIPTKRAETNKKRKSSWWQFWK